MKLLQTIDRLKQRACTVNEQEGATRRLEQMASPEEWVTETGDVVEVETMHTNRARELVEIYTGLSR